MVWGGPILTDAFADELAARQIPCISCQIGEPDQFAAERAPYVITVGQSPDQARAHLVEWLSKQVAGRTADFAGEDLQGQERVFGTLFLESDEDAAAQNQITQDMLAEEGIEIAESVAYQLDPARLQEQAAAAIARFKSAGVTSIIFSGDPIAPGTFTLEATAQDYFPEWIITGSALVDTTAAARSFDQEQWSHAFGISPLSARVSPEVAGSYYIYEWYTGEESPADGHVRRDPARCPRSFFGALQGTGPDLTRENWVATLLAAEATPSAISQPSLDWGEVAGLARDRLSRPRRLDRDLVGPRRHRPQRDPPGRPGHVPVRRRRRALLPRRVARRGHPGLRPRGRRRLLRGGPSRRVPAGLPVTSGVGLSAALVTLFRAGTFRTRRRARRRSGARSRCRRPRLRAAWSTWSSSWWTSSRCSSLSARRSSRRASVAFAWRCRSAASKERPAISSSDSTRRAAAAG